MTLLAAQVCGSTGHTLTLAVGSIVAADLTGDNTMSGRAGRGRGAGRGARERAALSPDGPGRSQAGSGARIRAGVLGSVLSMVGVIERSFPLFLAGMFLFGFGQASSLLGRFAAADVSTADQRGRAIGLIVGGATAGSIIGPNLMAPATTLGGLARAAGRRRPVPDRHRRLRAGGAADRAPAATGPAGDRAPLSHRRTRPVTRGRSTGRCGRSSALPRIRIAFGALMTSQLVMIGTTSTAAVYLQDHGHDVADDRAGRLAASGWHVRGLADNRVAGAIGSGGWR